MSTLRHFVAHLLVNAAGLYLVDYALTDFCFVREVSASCPPEVVNNVAAFLLGGLLLGVLNTFVKPLLKLVAMPLTFMTAGLFVFVINAVVLGLLVWLVQTLQISGIAVVVGGDSTWLTYLSAAVILGLFNLFTHWLVK